MFASFSYTIQQHVTASERVNLSESEPGKRETDQGVLSLSFFIFFY